MSTNGMPTATPASLLDEIIGSVREISTIPQIALRIIDVVNNPRSTGADLEAAVGSDPSLAARILRTANSAAFGLRRPVKTIAWAINVLGTNEVKNLAVTALIAERFTGDVVVASYTRKGLWRHMVCVGLAARMVASRAGLRNFSEAFLAGLLHDVGIALLDQYLRRPFAEVMTALKPGVPLCQVEREQLGFDHTQFGAKVAEQWRFPPVILSAIRHHHAPDRCDQQSRPIAQAVEVANFICVSKGIRSMGVSSVAPPNASTFMALSIDRQGLRVLYDDVDNELAKAHALINI